MGAAGEAAEEGAAGSEMEEQWDLVFKALGLGCKSYALAQSKRGSLLLSHVPGRWFAMSSPL